MRLNAWLARAGVASRRGSDELIKAGRITVNGVPLDEKNYIMKGAEPSSIPFHITVPPGRLWVMGDNRDNSEDSRFHRGLPGGGTVPVSDVVGKVWAIVWPFGRASFVHTPATFANPKLQ